MNAHQLNLVYLDCYLNDDSWIIMAGDPRMSLIKSDKATLFGPNLNGLTFSKPEGRLNCSFSRHGRLFFVEVTCLFVNVYCPVKLFHHLSRLLAPLHLLSMIILPYGSLSFLTLPIQILLQLL